MQALSKRFVELQRAIDILHAFGVEIQKSHRSPRDSSRSRKTSSTDSLHSKVSNCNSSTVSEFAGGEKLTADQTENARKV